MKYTIDGIYDQRTFNSLKDAGISSFSFDFRPTSFNFYQQYRFLDLIEHCYSENDRYFLHFSGEADFVIQKMIEDLEPYLNTKDSLNTFLEFSDRCSPKFYDQFKFPYFLHYSPELALENYNNSEFLIGMIFKFDELYEMHKEGKLFSFVQSFFQLTKNLELELVLSADWDSNFFPSLTELIDFDSISLPINSKVEVCYRNVDLGKLSEQLDIIKNQF